ncbi:MAG: hypothetical protein H7Z43_01620, partial [Clostridia bacterium]|nr:hypothetical protein [Deltaproteobacteria bacterium]
GATNHDLVHGGFAGAPNGYVASFGDIRVQRAGDELVLTNGDGGSVTLTRADAAESARMITEVERRKPSRTIFTALGLVPRAPDEPLPDLGKIDAARAHAHAVTGDLSIHDLDLALLGGASQPSKLVRTSTSKAQTVLSARDVRLGAQLTPTLSGTHMTMQYENGDRTYEREFVWSERGLELIASYRPKPYLFTSDARVAQLIFETFAAMSPGSTNVDLRNAYRAVTGR